MFQIVIRKMMPYELCLSQFFCRFKNTSMIIMKVGETFIIFKIKTNDSFATEKDSVNLY